MSRFLNGFISYVKNSDRPKLKSEIQIYWEGHLNYKNAVYTGIEGSQILKKTYLDNQKLFLTNLQGEFALVLWDPSQKYLLAARDKLGTRPLFYTIQNNTFYFASDLFTLLDSYPIPKIANEAMIMT